MGAYVVLDTSSIFALIGAYTAAGLVVDPAFTAAFGASRLLRRVRLPLDLAVAGVLAKAFPSLTQVRISALLGSVGGGGGAAAAGSKVPASGRSGNWFTRAAEASRAVVDGYGLAYLAATRCVVSLASVSSLYLAIRSGVDVPAALDALFALFPGGGAAGGGAAGAIAESKIAQAAGVWAVAAVTASPLLPLSVMGAAAVGHRVSEGSRK
jgi:hypothetical protein